ncbi:MAG: Smr/MutS family protein [Rhizobiales bacterium]|nr:Smr/MutS family protein [Hyphomicrobiales bacterium]MBI3674633.1 Smr/MutS family protein [Hyphomicrobiales bacterium]
MNRKPPDFALWTDVAKSVTPLKRRRAAKALAGSTACLEKPAKPHPSAATAHVPRVQAKSPPPLTGFDRRTTQKMTRGNIEIDSRLDLHGQGVELARMSLLQFLARAAATGARTVLIITGKGESPFARHTLHGSSHFHAPERQGRLRRLLPDWLNEAEFRRLVTGFQPAHPRHGGGGAYYVRLRRARERP